MTVITNASLLNTTNRIITDEYLNSKLKLNNKQLTDS